MKELHIPYGLDRTTREIVEPEDAARGRSCNCLCPGCEAPLLSRHPQRDDKRIHFAHDSKHPEAKPIDECPLSPYVALGMMLRHIAASLIGKAIHLNAYCKHVHFECCSTTNKSVFVTEGADAAITDCEPSPSLGGVTYDLKLSIDSKSYFVELIYPGKNKKELPAPEHLLDVGGVFCVSGPEFVEMMGKEDFKIARYSESVSQFLLIHSRKFWAYHYLEAEVTAPIRARHTCRRMISPQSSNRRKPVHFPVSSTGSYAPKYNQYSPINADIQQPPQTRAQTRHEAAEAYRRASRGESSGGGYSTNPAPPVVTPQYQGHERSYLLPPAFHNDGNQPLKEHDSPITGVENYECLFCGVEYSVNQGTAPTCPKCNRHLGARRK